MKWKLRLCRGLRGLGFLTIRGTSLGVPIIRIIIFGAPYLGKLQFRIQALGYERFTQGLYGENGRAMQS